MSVLLTREETERAVAFMRERGWTGGVSVLVRPKLYGIDGEHWCNVERVVQGDASPYPLRVDLGRSPGHHVGQFKLCEVIAARALDLRRDLIPPAHDELGEAIFGAE